MDTMTNIPSDDLDFEVGGEPIPLDGLDDLDDYDVEDEVDLAEESDELQGMISELMVRGYVIDDNLSYSAIRALYDRLYFVDSVDTIYEFLDKCNDVCEKFKDAVRDGASYVEDTHAKVQKNYSLIIDSKDAEFNEIDRNVRSDVLNKMLDNSVPFEDIASIDVDELVEEEYKFITAHYPDMSVMHSDMSRLRQHLNRAVKDAIAENLRMIAEISDEDILNTNSPIKIECPSHVDEIIRQVFVEDGVYYFVNTAGKRVEINKPVIHLLSCMLQGKVVPCWVPCTFESEGKQYMFASIDYMTFLKTALGLFRDRSSTKSDVVDLGVSVGMFMQINSHILFSTPVSLKKEKPVEFKRYALTTTSEEMREACRKLRDLRKNNGGDFTLGDIARFFCARTNTNYDTVFFQALIGLFTFFDNNVYLRDVLGLESKMQYNCDLNYLRAFTGSGVAADKIVGGMYLKYFDTVCGAVTQEVVDELIAEIGELSRKYDARRIEVLHAMRSNAMKYRFIEASKYEQCKLDLFARYVAGDCEDIYCTIANGMVINYVAKDFLNNYNFQRKNYVIGATTKSNNSESLGTLMHNIGNNLGVRWGTRKWESLDCVYTPSATGLIKCMHTGKYADAPIYVQGILDEADSEMYAAEIELLKGSVSKIAAVNSFEELPVDVVLAMISYAAYLVSQAQGDYQERIVVSTFADCAMGLDLDKVNRWLGVTKSESEQKIDANTFYDFQQMRYARELSEGAIGIAKHVIDLVYADKFEEVDAETVWQVLSGDFYKAGVEFLLDADSRLATVSVDATDEEKLKQARDQSLAQAVQDDGGRQAVEAWLSKYLRYLQE